eukprot:621403_1
MDYTKQWACQSCTFINEKSLDKCTICAAAKPKAIMPQKGAVPKAGQLVPAFGALPVTKLSPTVRPFKSFCAATDALALREAMGGIGTDEKVLIHILGHRTLAQRLAISHAYPNVAQKRNLLDDLVSETSDNFRRLLKGLLRYPGSYDAFCLRKAIKGLGTDEKVLVEILCTRTSAQLAALTAAYQRDYKRELLKDVAGDTSGDVKKLLRMLLTSTRPGDNIAVDAVSVRNDAQDLYKAGEKRWGTDEDKFIEIFALRSYAHLRQVFVEYEKVSKFDIAKSIEREMSGTLEMCFLALIAAAREPARFFADILHKSMKGPGTNDMALMRVVTTRSEIDLGAIKAQFAITKGGRSLRKWVEDDTSGDYQDLLIALMDG